MCIMQPNCISVLTIVPYLIFWKVLRSNNFNLFEFLGCHAFSCRGEVDQEQTPILGGLFQVYHYIWASKQWVLKP